jgi:hypothetical protein
MASIKTFSPPELFHHSKILSMTENGYTELFPIQAVSLDHYYIYYSTPISQLDTAVLAIDK